MLREEVGCMRSREKGWNVNFRKADLYGFVYTLTGIVGGSTLCSLASN